MSTRARWLVVLVAGAGIALIPPPAGITPQSWRLLAIFIATIVGSILQPVSAAAVVLLGVSTVAITGILPPRSALAGYGDPIVWLAWTAIMMSRGMVKTGLGRRIAFLLVRALGKHSLGLGYALVSTDLVLATVVPSNSARAGGVIFPIVKSLAEAYDSQPGPTARRLGAFLMLLIYQCDVIVCATFLTGQASNPLIARLARETTGLPLTYTGWLVAAIVPSLISLIVVPLLIYRLFAPEVRHTPAAPQIARDELHRMGSLSRSELVMLGVFLLVASLWMTQALHGIDYAVVALLGLAILLVSGVLTWDDLLSERSAWDVFIWYGGLVRLAEALGETGLTKRFAEAAAQYTVGWQWPAALVVLALIYFYAHYGFASITAHASAMYIPFLVVIIAAGAPPMLGALALAYFSNLSAGLTHYGTTPGPIYFAAGYVKQGTWWRIGLIDSFVTIAIWGSVGVVWWKVLGLW